MKKRRLLQNVGENVVEQDNMLYYYLVLDWKNDCGLFSKDY
jgi:hypothetical protein